jgi:hypothetical protein
MELQGAQGLDRDAQRRDAAPPSVPADRQQHRGPGREAQPERLAEQLLPRPQPEM